MPLLAVCRHPLTGHVSAESINPRMPPRGVVRGTEIDCADDAEFLVRKARIDARIAARQSRTLVAQTYNRSQKLWDAYVARAMQAGVPQRRAEAEADAVYPPRPITVPVVVQVDDDNITRSEVQAERTAHPVRAGLNRG